MAQTATPKVDAATVAGTYSVSVRTVLRLAAKGKIPSERVGRQRRFDLAEVAAVFRNAA